jgi:hypothetical protein
MQRNRVLRVFIVASFWALHLTTYAFSVQISWSGFLEPGAIENPWELDGDGELSEPFDEGTPFTVSVVVSSTAVQLETGIENLWAFEAESMQLVIDGTAATVVTVFPVALWDNRDLGLGDALDFFGVSVDADYLGVTRRFSSFAMFDPAVIDFFDPSHTGSFPIFESAHTLGPLSTYSEGSPVAVVLGGSLVSVTPVPLPGGFVFLFSGLIAARGIGQFCRS